MITSAKGKRGFKRMTKDGISAAGRFSVSDITLIGLVTAVTCVLGPLSIPIFISLVPVTLTNLVLYLSLYILKTRRAFLSYLVYMLLGTAGLPVFSGFSGGIGKLMGPTGGYLVGFAFLVLIAGYFVERWPENRMACGVGMVLGTAVCYGFGTLWLCRQLSIGFIEGLGIGVLPYLIGDGVKIFLALWFGPVIENRISKAIGKI